MLGESAEAQAYYKRVQILAPQDPRGWYAMGLSEFNAGRLEEAKAAWEKSLQLTPKSSRLRKEIEQWLQAYRQQIRGQTVPEQHKNRISVTELMIFF